MGVPQSSGHVTVRDDGSQIFYWHFPHQPKQGEDLPEEKVPLLIWLQGGPGSSTIKDAMSLNGPYFYGPDGLRLNEHSWTQFANMVFVDNPIGVGYSQSASKAGLSSSMTQISEDFNAFLTQFFAGEGAKYKSSPFYISGASYAGKYTA